MSTISSPCRYFNLLPKTTPAGVPVDIISPLSKVMVELSFEIISYGFMVIILVDEFCRSWPFTVVFIKRFPGSFISSAVVIHGPHGANVSNPFARVNCTSLNCISRAETSLNTMYPNMTFFVASSRGVCCLMAKPHRY